MPAPGTVPALTPGAVAVPGAVAELFAVPRSRKRPSRIPPGPPRSPATDGPAVGIEPLCGVTAVCTAYAAGAATPESTAAPTTAATQRRRPLGSSSAAPASTPSTSTTHRIHGRNSGDHPSSTNAHTAVPAVVTASVIRAAQRVAVPQQDRPADRDRRGDPGRQRHRVVRVDDPAHEAEHQHRDHRPAAPQQQRGPRPVGACGPAGEPQRRHQQDQRRRQQPAHLRRERLAEQPQQPRPDRRTAAAGATAHRGHPPAPPGRRTGNTRAGHSAAATTTGTAALAAEDAAQAVVAERQPERRVVARTRRCTGRADTGHSATASSHHPAPTTIATPAPRSCVIRRRTEPGAAHRYAERQPGHHEEAPAGSSPGTRTRSPGRPAAASACPAALESPRTSCRYAGRDHQQRQQRVRVVEPEHQRGDRGEREQRAGHQPGARPGRPAAPPRTAARRRRRPSAPAAPASTRTRTRRPAPRSPSATATRAACPQ